MSWSRAEVEARDRRGEEALALLREHGPAYTAQRGRGLYAMSVDIGGTRVGINVLKRLERLRLARRVADERGVAWVAAE